jgi:predicted deacylase
MKIGSIEAPKGQKAFGRFKTGVTHADFSVDIPLHIIHGAGDGPVLLVQAGVSGLEIEPAMSLPGLVKQLDPAQMAGTLILVPLLNTTGFEFEQRNAIWDDKNLNALRGGRADGSVSERMVHRYFGEVVNRADAVLDVHTGSLSGYYRYAGVYDVGAPDRSAELARALGLPQVLLGQPADESMAYAAAQDGKSVVSLWIGGGPGLRDYGAADAALLRQAVLNAVRHLGMGGPAVAAPGPASQVLKLNSIIQTGGEPGLVFMNTGLRGQRVLAGDSLGYVRHAFTGARIRDIAAPRDGVVLHAGCVWPVVRQTEDTTLAILGDLVE